MIARRCSALAVPLAALALGVLLAGCGGSGAKHSAVSTTTDRERDTGAGAHAIAGERCGSAGRASAAIRAWAI